MQNPALLGGMLTACQLEASAATKPLMVTLAPASSALTTATPNRKATANVSTSSRIVLLTTPPMASTQVGERHRCTQLTIARALWWCVPFTVPPASPPCTVYTVGACQDHFSSSSKVVGHHLELPVWHARTAWTMHPGPRFNSCLLLQPLRDLLVHARAWRMCTLQPSASELFKSRTDVLNMSWKWNSNVTWCTWLSQPIIVMVHSGVLAGGFCCSSAAALLITPGYPNQCSGTICAVAGNTNPQGYRFC
jgi:hypothetical protein